MLPLLRLGLLDWRRYQLRPEHRRVPDRLLVTPGQRRVRDSSVTKYCTHHPFIRRYRRLGRRSRFSPTDRVRVFFAIPYARRAYYR